MNIIKWIKNFIYLRKVKLAKLQFIEHSIRFPEAYMDTFSEIENKFNKEINRLEKG